MPITYEFIFRDGGSGSTPTSSNTIPVNPGQAGSAGSVELPQSKSPPTVVAPAGSVTREQVAEIVNRAADRQAEQRPTPPVSGQQAPTEQSTTIPIQQRDGQRDGTQGQAPTIPVSPPTQPRPAAGEATLDAIQKAVERSGSRDSDRQAPVTPASQGSGQGEQQRHRIEIPVQQPTASPTAAQGPTQPPQQHGQPTQQVVQNFFSQQAAASGAPGQRALPEHPDLPSLKQNVPPLPQHQPPTQPKGTPDQEALRSITGFVSEAGSAFGVPGAGSVAALAGASGPAAAITGSIGMAALLAGAYSKEVSTLASYSPEIASAQATADMKETARLMEQARKYGELDAKQLEQRSNLGRAIWQYGVSTWRDIQGGELSGSYPNKIWTILENLGEAIEEFNRKTPHPVSPLQHYMDQYGHVPDPWPFNDNQGVTIHDSNDYGAVITGL